MKVKFDKIEGNKVYFTTVEDGIETHYMTNSDGTGLFEADNFCKQYKGNAQFQLWQSTKSGMRKAIIRALEG